MASTTKEKSNDEIKPIKRTGKEFERMELLKSLSQHKN